MKMIFLVDGDNNIGTGLQGIDLLTAEDTVLVFFGKGQTLANVKKLCAGTKAQVQYLESVKGGKNSLDFQIITELGVLVGRGEADFAYVISQDKGYEAAMSALHARYASTFREVALRPSIQDCLQAAFLLRAGTREELAAALARQYGPVQGQLAYEHLEALLTPPPVQEAAAPSPAAQRLVMSLIYDDIKAGRDGDPEKFAAIHRDLVGQGCDCAVLACHRPLRTIFVK